MNWDEIIDRLSVSHLRLSPRSYNALQKANIKSLSDLIELNTSGLNNIDSLGDKSINEINVSLINFLYSIENSNIDFKYSSYLISFREDIFFDYKIYLLNEAHLKQPISTLNLSNRANNFLKKANVYNIEDLSDFRLECFYGIKGLGKTSIRDIESKLEFYCEKLYSSSDAKYFKDEDHRFDLVKIIYSNSLPNALLMLPVIAENLFVNLNNTRSWEILKRRYSIDNDKIYSLEDLGAYFDITRERVRQIQNESEIIIRDTILNIKDSLKLRLDNEIFVEYNYLHSHIVDNYQVASESDIVYLLKDRYDINGNIEEIKLIHLLMSIFGFKLIPKRITLNSIDHEAVWKTDNNIKNTQLSWTIDTIKKALRKNVVPLSLFDINVLVNRKKRNERVSNEYINSALKIIKGVEYLGNDNYQIAFHHLVSLADKAYRLLKIENKPLHLKEITRRINNKLSQTDNFKEIKIHGQLNSDDRFSPIGKSGKWILKEWPDYSTLSTIDIMKEFFHKAQKSSTVDNIYSYVKDQRPDIPKKSINTLLKIYTDTFVQVSKNKYELKSWGSKPHNSVNKYPRKHSANVLKPEFCNLIIQYFENNQTTDVRLTVLKKVVLKEITIPESTISIWFNQLPIIELYHDPKHGKYKRVKYIGSNDELVNQFLTNNRYHQSEEVYKKIINFLDNQPDKRAEIKEIKNHLTNNFSYKSPLIYKKINELVQSKKIGKEIINNKHFCYLPISDEFFNSKIIGFEKHLLSLNDEELKNDLKKIVATISVDNVDQNLFQILKIFEKKLKEYLLLIKYRMIFDVSNNDLRNLASMMDCLVKNKIVKKEHHLALLREIRNERAHEVATKEYRTILMHHFPFIGDICLTYINLLDNNISKLKDL